MENVTEAVGDEGSVPAYPLVSPEILCVVIIIMSFLSVIGTAGNLLVLYVFAKKRDKLTSTVFILALAAVDFTTCLVVIPYTIYMEYMNFHIPYDFLCKAYYFFITSNIPCSALIMVAIGIDRYFCICHPFLHAITLRRAKVMVAFLFLIASGIGIVVALLYGVYTYEQITVYGNVTSQLDGNTSAPEYTSNSEGNRTNSETRWVLTYTGECQPNTVYLQADFLWYYQKFYTALFLACLIIVIVLYVLIYRSVLSRRSRRCKEKSKSTITVSSPPLDADDVSQAETLLTTVNGEASNSVRNGNSSASKKGSSITADPSTSSMSKKEIKEKKKRDKKSRKSTKKDRNRIANLKTAVMLFVVTVVFIVLFLPAFLMALQLIPYNIIVFYMYFAYNVSNPVIYSFMNNNFREDLKKMFCWR